MNLCVSDLRTGGEERSRPQGRGRGGAFSNSDVDRTPRSRVSSIGRSNPHSVSRQIRDGCKARSWMSAISARKRRGTAQRRLRLEWVAPLTIAQSSASEIDLQALLPGHHSPIEQIVLSSRPSRSGITAICIRLSRPTRAETDDGAAIAAEAIEPVIVAAVRVAGIPPPTAVEAIGFQVWLSKASTIEAHRERR